MSSDIAIRLSGVSKSYAVFSQPQDRLKQMLAFGRRKYYQEFWALQDVDLEIKRGESIGVIGRNGAGKSTFLQLICGTLTPSIGTVEVNGRIAAMLELGAGFNPEFTGGENVHLAATVLGLSPQEVTERYDSILEFAGIGDFIDQPVKLYSSGMFARLAFAVAAHVDADILIVDEILAVGDISFTQKCMRFIRKFRETGTLLFVTHDVAAVLNLCEKTIWIDRGNIREIGPSNDICHNYVAAMQAEQEGSVNFQIGGRRRPASTVNDKPVRDIRADLLEKSNHSTKIELYEFDFEAPWYGLRGAEITNVWLERPTGDRLTMLTGGEEVVLNIDCRTSVELTSPIVGFQIKDRLGQILFGDNTFLTYQLNPVIVKENEIFCASFQFQMPYLPTGDYVILVAVVDGTQNEFINHCWIDEALIFKVHSGHVTRGLVGIPMLAIKMEVSSNNNQISSM